MEKLTGIEAGRGVAALLVVTMHVSDHLRQASGSWPLGGAFAFGHAGVDFFFVLSGFIILHVHARDIGQNAALGRYLQRRISRIYPLYWLVLVAALLALAIRHPLPPLGGLIASALLLPVAGDMPIGVAWTLQHEIVFYAAFAFLIVSRRLGMLVFGLWLTAIVAALAGADLAWLRPGALRDMITCFDAEFFMGLLAAFLLARTRVPWPRMVLLLGVAGLGALATAEDFGVIRGLVPVAHLGYGLASLLVVLGIAATERQGWISVPNPLIELGKASYALYLLHLLTIGAVWQALLKLGLNQRLPAWSLFVVLLATAVAVGVIASRLIERPLTRLVRLGLVAAGRGLKGIEPFAAYRRRSS